MSDHNLYCQKLMEFFNAKARKKVPDYEADLFKGGYVDSLFAIEIVVFIEKEFGFKLKNKDVKKENFRNIDAIAQLIEKYKVK